MFNNQCFYYFVASNLYFKIAPPNIFDDQFQNKSSELPVQINNQKLTHKTFFIRCELFFMFISFE